ncbi:MAG TPA: site-specific integrase [Terriglobales bacterium]|nr:site-specific integrase [Terriglobales bacterium]
MSEKGNERQGYFSPAEIERVIENLPGYLQPFTRFAWLTGMRKGEIASLEWADVDGDVIKLQAEDAKTVFRTPAGLPIREFRKSWRTACRKAGVSGRLFHALRRSAIRWMTRAGVQRHIAMKISGHKSESTFERYNIGDVTDQRVALRATQQYLRTVVEN